MAAVEGPDAPRLPAPLRAVGQAVLRAYAGVLFSRSLLVGALLIAATATAPRGLIGGLLGTLLALGSARLLGVERDGIHDGSYAVSALLLGLGVGQWFGLTATSAVLLLVFAPLSVLLNAALRSLVAPARLPVLSLAFLGAFNLLLGLASAAGLAYVHAEDPAPSALAAMLPAPLLLLLRSIGALFFIPRADAGALVLLALAVQSRISTLLAALAMAGCLLLRAHIPAFQDAGLFHSLAYNAAFTAVALGGVWFVPSPSSFLLALTGVTLCALVTLGSWVPLGRLGLPVLVVPFNTTVLVMLLALRQRAFDQRPKSVDFAAGTPEQNLAYFRTRRARFQSLHAVRFTLPVRGAWTCTQGIDGPHTHKGPWRHAYDFEVHGADGSPCVSSHPPEQLADFRCYRLPVLATAAGTVVKTVSEVVDNPVGGVNLAENWGNLVILQHGPGLYSMVAHLAYQSVKVVPGQVVRAGEVLGLCGNTGRSPQPHVHFQLQSGPQLGDPTIPCRFADGILVSAEPPRVVAALTPQAGETVRSLDPDHERAAFFQFPYGMLWPLRRGAELEHVHSEIDLYGQLLLRSQEHGACLYYACENGFFTAYDLVGAPGSVLQLLRAALSRVPMDASETLRWTDLVPTRVFRGRLGSWLVGGLLDFVSPFFATDSIEVEYAARRQGTALLITGESRRRDRHGRPILETLAELQRGVGPVRLRVSVRGHVTTATLSEPAEPSAAADAPPASPMRQAA